LTLLSPAQDDELDQAIEAMRIKQPANTKVSHAIVSAFGIDIASF
jgi:hypothetical protein